MNAALRMAARHVARLALKEKSRLSEPAIVVDVAKPQTHGDSSSWLALRATEQAAGLGQRRCDRMQADGEPSRTLRSTSHEQNA